MTPRCLDDDDNGAYASLHLSINPACHSKPPLTLATFGSGKVHGHGIIQEGRYVFLSCYTVLIFQEQGSCSVRKSVTMT